MSDETTRWAGREIAKRLATPKADTSKAGKELAKVSRELENVADAVARVGFSKTLENKLATLEASRERLTAEIAAAETVIEAPDLLAIRAKWRDVVVNLGSLSSVRRTRKYRAARNALQGILGVVKVDREGSGYADLRIGAPTSMVAGACFAMSL